MQTRKLNNLFCHPTDQRRKALISVDFLPSKCVDRRGFSALVFSTLFVTLLHSIIRKCRASFYGKRQLIVPESLSYRNNHVDPDGKFKWAYYAEE